MKRPVYVTLNRKAFADKFDNKERICRRPCS